MYICSHDTFLGLKIVKKGVLREWGFYFCLRFRRHFFLDIPKWVVGGFLEKYFWSWRSWKNVQVVSLYTCFRGFLIKNRRMCNNLKNALLPHFYVFLWLRMVCVNWWSWVAAKHTAINHSVFLSINFTFKFNLESTPQTKIFASILTSTWCHI